MIKSPTDNKIKVKACLFDAYGTLFDLASATAKNADKLGDRAKDLSVMWRDKQLQYTWLRSLQGLHADFYEVTKDALDYSMNALGIIDNELKIRLLDSFKTLDCYPEVFEILQQLKTDGFTIAILSNGTPKMLQDATSHAGIDQLIDSIFSAEQVGIFKTNPSMYQLALDKLSVNCSDVLFVSSNSWDAYAASAFGMNVAWCNRFGQNAENLPGNPNFEIKDLTKLPDIVVTD